MPYMFFLVWMKTGSNPPNISQFQSNTGKEMCKLIAHLCINNLEKRPADLHNPTSVFAQTYFAKFTYRLQKKCEKRQLS